ncbi:hypothetical protein [uncultured Prevotella sp.]|uniref:hypothetical protein n=1 Tax=uncultured Prevotella sp. TaxID=159272 RepID=UPI002639E8F6|nr:hypothetical protein [uncultured Prevotella sp.]
MNIISSFFLQNDSGRGHIFASIHGRMNILLEDFRLPYEPARIFAKAESIFERLTECETAPILFLDKEIEQTVRARSANYACMVMLMLMEIIQTEPMPAFLLPRSRYRTYLRGKFRVFNKEDILARWNDLKEAEVAASSTKRTQRTTTVKPAAEPQAHYTPVSKTATATAAQEETPSAATEAEPDKCSLADFVDFIISEGSADDCRRLKQMLQDYDYKRGNRYKESVIKLTTRIKQLNREDRQRMQAGNTYNITGGTVNNVGSTIGKQQNNRKYGE